MTWKYIVDGNTMFNGKVIALRMTHKEILQIFFPYEFFYLQKSTKMIPTMA